MRNASDYERVPTNGVTLAVHEHGSGKPVVLCHGWPEMGWSWRHQVGPLAAAGYRAIVPNQRGYWLSDRPEPVEDYDINALTGDLVGLLDHYGEERAVFVGHDWGAIVVWALAQLHPDRVAGVVNLSVPFMQRGPTEWVGFWESQLGGDFYIVHFNRQPGVADAAFEENTRQFLRNIYRAEQWKEPGPPAQPGMPLINLARQAEPRGKAFMDDEELDVFVRGFEESGFTGGINWYRNFTRNWHILGDAPQVVQTPSLVIYGQYDVVPKSPTLERHVPNVEVHTLECGHWIQQEKAAETNALMLEWLGRHYPA